MSERARHNIMSIPRKRVNERLWYRFSIIDSGVEIAPHIDIINVLEFVCGLISTTLIYSNHSTH